MTNDKLIADARECIQIMRERGMFSTARSVFSQLTDRLEAFTQPSGKVSDELIGRALIAFKAKGGYSDIEKMRAALEAALSSGAITPKWSRKFKGSKHGGAFIYTHPNAFEGRAIVENHRGVFFNGVEYGTVDEAKNAALTLPSGKVSDEQYLYGDLVAQLRKGDGLAERMAAADILEAAQLPARPVVKALTLNAEELDTILAIGKNEQSGRVTNYELQELVRVYREILSALEGEEHE